MKRVLSLVALFATAMAQRGDGRPNVVVFVMDDLPFLTQWEESAPTGNNLEGLTVELESYPTPRIDEFRSESVIFAKSYCGAPKCAPSRMCLLTGRQAISCEYAIEETLNAVSRKPGDSGISSGIYGTGVSVMTMKMQGKDAEYNIPTALRDAGYFTGMVGKWHMMPDDDMGHDLDCLALELFPNEDLYLQCKDILKEVGFDRIEGWYYGNIKSNDYFSHNPEWMVNEAAKFVEEAVSRDEPFFLYFASTLVHSPDAGNALQRFGPEDTPKGKLVGRSDDPTGKTTMWDRTELLEYTQNEARDAGLNAMTYAAIFWADQQFGALIDALERFGVYDDTYVVFQNDHGQIAKGLMYEQGSRILNFQRFPAKWGKNGPMMLPDSFVTSNVDLAATIFEMAGVTPSSEYQVDGESFLEDVTSALNDPSFDQVEDGGASCEYKFMDAKNSYSMVSGQYQYIFRATDDVDTMYDVDKLYPNTRDLEQLYDLDMDPNQKVNIFQESGARVMANSEVISEFQTIMREYIDLHCIAQNGQQCVKPDLMFGTSGGGYFDLPEGPQCVTDGDCSGSDEFCQDGQCLHGDPVDTPTPVIPEPQPGCTHNGDCDSNEVCVDGECLHGDPNTPTPVMPEPQPGCVHNGDCDADELCVGGECVPFTPVSPAPIEGCTGDCCSDDDCRGSQVCTDGTCGRPARDTSSGSSGGSSDGGCTSDDACRGSQVCTDGVCGRPVRDTSGGSGGSSGSSGRGSGGGGGRGGRGMEKQAAVVIDSAIVGESESGWSLQNATVSVSTLMLLAAAAVAMWIVRWCFGKMGGAEKESAGRAMYGAV